ncbi:mitochondrial import inner membrane translocase subunit Tim13 [Episyrphus balteatus]|uniref:mitochondrial import inner membrane translocase subunit Tim13 n=1 Tax=Episyrphus balteatus TaxID=286459 RepID=UPI002485CE79|nr:mitochondrial import inner membrane translocase subunit Tim13 [Episyrphus balteatus]
MNMDVLDNPAISQLDSSQRAELMKQVRQQLAVASTQELLEKMSRKCFNKCINKPGSSLDSSEQKCIAMCMDRFMDSWSIVSRAYFTRLQRESTNM